MKPILLKNKQQKRRRQSVRRKIRMTTERPRLTVHRSHKHINAAIVDDAAGVTLCAVGTSAKRFASDLDGKKKSEKAAFIGAEIARLAKEKGVSNVVFDRGPYMYHGRVKALADSARESGLQF
jgi:large subunit ribosomal protein L18